MFSVIENSLNLDALYLMKLIFGEYFCYFDSNHVAVLLQLQLYLDVNRVLVRERVNIFLSSMKAKVAIKFPKKLFFLPKIGLALKGLMLRRAAYAQHSLCT